MSQFGPSSQASDPYKTSADSPDSLPPKGYSIDQLADYIFRQLGAPTWEVELTKQQVLDCINDALALYSTWVPNTRVGNIILVRGQFKYLQGYDVDQGIIDVSFVEPNPVPTEIFVHQSFTAILSTLRRSFASAWTSMTSFSVGVKLGSA